MVAAEESLRGFDMGDGIMLEAIHNRLVDRRYERAWQSVEARKQAGEPMGSILRSMPTRELIAALASGVGQRDPVAANVLATELLNREVRAPFLGAAIASAAFVVALLVADTIISGRPFFVLGEPYSRAFAVLVIAVLAGLFSILMYATWRGRLPHLSRAVAVRRNGGRY